MAKRITLVLLILLQTLHVGDLSIKDAPLWALHKYKYTTLLKQEPFCWCPYKSYLIIDKYVEVKDHHNTNHIIIKSDIVQLVKDDAEYNKSHAHKYKGKPKTRLRKIYRYCHKTEYVAHVKTAKEVFQTRQGDCAGISSAFYVLCKANKIPCRYVIGWTQDSCHAWNRVKVGGKWYYVDATKGMWLRRKLPKGWSIMEQW